VLTGKGVTAWRNAITDLAPAASPAQPAPRPSPAGMTPPASHLPALPAHLATELISVLAGLVLAGTVP
jgi:hypothetical protein